jgi:CheY-like chemotaxis protein
VAAACYSPLVTIPILVVDADHEFAKLIQQKLEASGQYSVQLASTAAAALAALPVGSFRLAIVDFALPDLTGAELIRRLRAGLRGISIIALPVSQDQPTVVPGEMPPDGLLTKPVYMPDLIQAVNRALGLATESAASSAGAGQTAGAPAAPWGLPPEFADPMQLDSLLERLSRECSAYAVLLSRKGRIVAYAGSMPQAHVNEIADLLVKHAVREDLPGAVARFFRLPGAAEDFLLYALPLNGEILLTLLYPARMPFSTVRVQGERLEAVLTGLAPEPARAPAPRATGAIGLRPTSPPTLPRDWIPNREQARAELPHETGIAEPIVPLRPSAASRRADPQTPDRSPRVVADDELWPRVDQDGESQVGASSHVSAAGGRAVYGLVLAPRLPEHRLDRPLAGRLQTWTMRLCQASKAAPQAIDVRSDYLVLTVELPSQIDPAGFVERLQRELSDSLLAAYPGLAASLPGGRFWAERYLLTPAITPSPEAIRAFLRDLRADEPPSS